MKRYGMAIRLKPKYTEDYISLHQHPSDELIKALEQANIHNNTVFLAEGVLFNYFEYTGSDFNSDWEKYTEAPIVKDIFQKMKGFFEPLGEIFSETGWTVMNEVFRKE